MNFCGQRTIFGADVTVIEVLSFARTMLQMSSREGPLSEKQ